MNIDWTRELQNYVRLDTSPSGVGYMQAIDYLVGITSNIEGLVYRVFIPQKYPILLITKPGLSKQSILLHSDVDVASVGLETDNWKYSPFSGTYDKNDDCIYGRGTQSMKSQSIQYFAALHNLQNINPSKTIHLLFTTYGDNGGISTFIKSVDFIDLDVKFIITEGLVSPTKKYFVFYTERTLWKFNIIINTTPGNVTMPMNNTCEIKLRKLLNIIADFRIRDAERGGKNKTNRRIGETTTINLTNLETIQFGEILPNRLVASFEMYIGKYTTEDEIMNEIKTWARIINDEVPNDENNNIKIDWIKKYYKSPTTDISNKMCEEFLRSLTNQDIKYNVTISPGHSHASLFRNEGIPVLGFTPINNTPTLVHANNEFVKKTQFLDNINLLTNIIKDLTF